jgi:hypothetical protein
MTGLEEGDKARFVSLTRPSLSSFQEETTAGCPSKDRTDESTIMEPI